MQIPDKQEKQISGLQVEEIDSGMNPGGKNLSFDRTRMAAERTLMAWVRTALSMISFGFTIYKFLEAMLPQSTSPVLRADTPRNVGLSLIGIGTFALIVACVQHVSYLRVLGIKLRSLPWDLSFLVGCLIALLGFLMFWSIVLNSGPFS